MAAVLTGLGREGLMGWLFLPLYMRLLRLWAQFAAGGCGDRSSGDQHGATPDPCEGPGEREHPLHPLLLGMGLGVWGRWHPVPCEG